MGSPVGAAACAVAPLLLWNRRALGAGDVKLFAALGALLGVQGGLLVEALALGGALATGTRRVGPWALLALIAGISSALAP